MMAQFVLEDPRAVGNPTRSLQDKVKGFRETAISGWRKDEYDLSDRSMILGIAIP
jgi:hypothetical protein